MKRPSVDFDVMIVGGGPAGLSAALWCRDLGINAMLFERSEDLGGQLLSIYDRIENHLGFSAADGRELRDRFIDHVTNRRVPIGTRSAVASIDVEQKTITLDDGETYSARAIIIATGVRRRELGVPGEKEFVGKGILHSGAGSRRDVSGQKIVIVGGGDAAIENSVILSEFAEKVTVIHRRGEFRARPELIAAARTGANIEFVLDTEVTAINGNEAVTSVDVINKVSRDSFTIAADAVLIRIGVQPNTEMLNDQLVLDSEGYVRVDSTGKSSAQGIFAVGDVANPISPTISTAVGSGASAAKAANALITTSPNV